MGVGASRNKSTTDVLNKSLTESLSSQMVSIASSSVNTAQPTQVIKISGSAGRDFNLSGVSQVAVVNIDVAQFVRNVSETRLQQIMTNALTTAARDNQSVDHQLIIGASVSDNVSAARVRNETISRAVSTYSYSQFLATTNSVLASQTIEIPAVAGRDVNLSNISQYIKIEIIAKQIADVLTSAVMDIASTNNISTKKDSSQKTSAGLSTAWLMIGFIIFVIVAGIVGVYYILHAMSGGGDGGGGAQPIVISPRDLAAAGAAAGAGEL